jgi:hypothetical protein
MDRPWHEDKQGMEESYYHAHDLDQVTNLSSEVDAEGAILMELLEDLPPSDLEAGDVDYRLSHVIRSLEAEIGGGAAAAVDGGSTAAGASSEEEGGFVEDMLLDLDLGGYGHESGSFGFWAPEVPLAMGHAAEGWYLYADACEGSVVGYEGEIGHQSQYVESAVVVEQVYSPLWDW